MKHITEQNEIVRGREYWLRDKQTGEAWVSMAMQSHNASRYDQKVSTVPAREEYEKGLIYFHTGTERVFTFPGDNNAFARWEIFGPLPSRAKPDFEALKFGRSVAQLPVAVLRMMESVISGTASPDNKVKVSNNSIVLLGWVISRITNGPFIYVEFKAPNGYATRVSNIDRNPENILYMLGNDLIKAAQEQ